MVDYKIDIADKNMTFEKEESVINNIFLSLKVIKGTFFQNPDFGMALPPKKRTADAKNIIKQNIENALQWIIDIERVTKIYVFTEDDVQDVGRINYKVSATQADGLVVVFDNFVTVA